MNDTYHLSAVLVRGQYWLYLGLTTIALASFIAITLREGTDLSAGYLAGAIAVFAIFHFRRVYKKSLAIASGHSVTLAADAMIVRDGATERKVRYDAIELLRIRRPLFGPTSFTLEGSGMPRQPFYGYERMDRLVSDLSHHLPGNRVSDGRDLS